MEIHLSSKILRLSGITLSTAVLLAFLLPSRVDLNVWKLKLTRQCLRCSFRHTELNNMDLSEVDLRYTDFYGATFSNVDLSHADLSYSNLKNATFNGVVLRETRLCGIIPPDALNPTLMVGRADCTIAQQ